MLELELHARIKNRLVSCGEPLLADSVYIIQFLLLRYLLSSLLFYRFYLLIRDKGEMLTEDGLGLRSLHLYIAARVPYCLNQALGHSPKNQIS